MLPINRLPVDVSGLTPEMKAELEERILEFERDHEDSAKAGDAGYVEKIRKGDFMFAGIINVAIVIYMIIAVLVM